jgi:hypothetical protein
MEGNDAGFHHLGDFNSIFPVLLGAAGPICEIDGELM